MWVDGFLCMAVVIGYSMFLAGICAGKSPERSEFPPDFLFGVGSSAYQVEGAFLDGGKGPSIWDTFTHEFPEKIADRSDGDVSVDFYKRYKEDIRRVKEMGLDVYRFSLSWPRILPRGNLRGGVNMEAIKHYNNLINELILHGIKPFVTLFHWDVPQALEDDYGGFLSSKIVDDFRDYCDICFREFGDRVKHWITINEGWTISVLGYDDGIYAPGRCSIGVGNCSEGNSAIEPYQVAHNLILSHANAVQLYRNNYKKAQDGVLGMSIYGDWMVPLTNSTDDQHAVIRGLHFMFGWFLEPASRGDYPAVMREYVGNRLPNFSKEEKEIVNGSYDFIGINYYTASYAFDLQSLHPTPPIDYFMDTHVGFTGFVAEKNGVPIGPKANSTWIYVYPQGLKEALVHMKNTYNNPIIYITENGVNEQNMELPLDECLNDTWRVNYQREHLSSVLEAIRDGVRVKGYFMWSHLDSFEWQDGYTSRFGFYYVDFKNNLTRYPKLSAHWVSSFLLGVKNPNPKYEEHGLRHHVI
ncbi:beta-glucosidase 24 isoform X1 [Amborella trichopoda]|uniref:beta-glucosidase 24 isoform X1 n=1 Tax=Amborella trichopoda TaxID=13333 RepID=UPI0009C171E6|nr:beta-glucosidase 24 isoform X1 [Amborella trichopoda]|eukprot:XP_020524845.1 beta-glucosidase 24 isoform X1 [Amborella trichopoda]